MWSRYREWSLGIKTASWVDVDELGFDAECHGYEPISYTCFETVINDIQVDPDRDVFLEYGCGKGRAVVLAAMKPFHKVIGVELSDELCRIARDNVHRASKKLSCLDVEIVNTNACEYELPSNVSVIFLWNSFVGSVLEGVARQIHQSLRLAPRRLTLVYALPQGEADIFADRDWLTNRRELRSSFWTGVDLFVYDADVRRI